MIDLNLLAKGEGYEKLNRSYVIFICLDDIFKGGRHIYTFENRCIQNPDIALGDETTKIFLNPHSEMDDVSPGLANFLKFLIDGKPMDEFTERLVEAVEAAKNNKMLELEYMSYYANMHDKYNERHKEGIEAFILDNIEERISAERILQKLQKRFSLSEEKAGYYYDKFSDKA